MDSQLATMYIGGSGPGRVRLWVVAVVVLTIGSGIAAFVAVALASTKVRVDPLVVSPAGVFRGLKPDDGEYSMFLGIPYAQVEKDNPFGASIPQPKFDTVYEAHDDSAICPQVEEFGNTIVGTLDCLHLNIYVPEKADMNNRLPVLVWIYGGGFRIGFANRYLYGPKYLVRHDVVLVTLNYRVGPYGFFCLEIPEIPGNQGLKDQMLALRWIKENIESFGGDVNKITVMGESAGGASLDFHLLSKREKLFNQAILQSGSAYIPTLFEELETIKPLRIARHLGLETEDVVEAVEFLAKLDTNIVIAATSELSISSRPCVEKVFESVESIMTEHPINLDIPTEKSIPILVGFNDMESLLSYVNMAPETFKSLNIFEDSLKMIYKYDDFKEMENVMKRFYIGDEGMSDALRWNLIDFQSDFMYNIPVQISLKKYLSSGAKDIFYYMFSYNGGRNFVKQRRNVTVGGAAHADEIGYLFDISYMSDAPSAEDQLVIDQMTKLWTNFVKYGDPTPETSELLPVKWTALTEDTYTYLNIDKELTIGRRPYNNRTAFWELFYDANKTKLKWYLDN